MYCRTGSGCSPGSATPGSTCPPSPGPSPACPQVPIYPGTPALTAMTPCPKDTPAEMPFTCPSKAQTPECELGPLSRMNPRSPHVATIAPTLSQVTASPVASATDALTKGDLHEGFSAEHEPPDRTGSDIAPPGGTGNDLTAFSISGQGGSWAFIDLRAMTTATAPTHAAIAKSQTHFRPRPDFPTTGLLPVSVSRRVAPNSSNRQ